MTFSRLTRVNVTVGATAIQVTPQSSVSYFGVTFTFDRPMPVGTFVTGEPFVVSDQAFQITSITPASVDLRGDGYIGNGAMKDPIITDVQGFDGYLQDGTGSLGAANVDYANSQNVDPAINGNLAIALGEKTSIVKSVRLPAVSTPNEWQTIQKYVTLTVLDRAPDVGAYRPGFAGASKKIRTRSDVSYVPRGYALPASFPPISTILSRVPSHIGIFDSDAEDRRRTRLDATIGVTNDNYSGELVGPYAQFVYALNSTNISVAQRQLIEDRIISFANDIESLIEAGFRENATRGQLAGQGGGVWLWLIAAAAITRDASYLDAANLSVFQPTGNGFWVSPTDVGIPVSGGSGVAAQTFFEEHVGIPWVVPDEDGSHHAARYLHIAAEIIGWELVAALSFNQGPAGYADGLAMILDNGPNTSLNPRAATLNFVARRPTWNINWAVSYDVDQDWRDSWNQMVSLVGFTPWAGPPDQPGMGDDPDLNDDYFTASDGAITLNTQGIDYATEAVTRRDMRYSLDNIQWVTVADVALTGTTYTETGLLRGAEHWCGWRMVSASGAGAWSPNFPYNLPYDSGNDRSKVTPTGAGAATAPSYAGGVEPEIHVRKYPAWDYKVWESVGGILDADAVELAAGVGYPSAGFPAPTYAYQWQRSATGNGTGFSNIPGATGAEYTRTAADAEQVLRCQVTATNASGSVAVFTGEVECPALSVLPATTLIQADFKGRFSVDYEAELASVAASGCSAEHRPTFSEATLVHNTGALYGDKTSGNPFFDLPLQNPAIAGTTYTISGQALARVYASFVSFSGVLSVEVMNGSGTTFFSATLDPDQVKGVSYLLDISDSFTVPGGTTDLDLFVRVRNATATGGEGGGDPVLTALTIQSQ